MISLADHADDDGNNVFPSVGYTAWKTDYSERQVQRTLGELRAAGLLVAVSGQKGGRNKTTRYRIDLSKGVSKEPFKGTASANTEDDVNPDTLSPLDPVNPDTVSPFEELKGDNDGTERVTSAVLKGDIHDIKGDTAMSPESPVVIINKETSEETLDGDGAKNHPSGNPPYFAPIEKLEGFKNRNYSTFLERLEKTCSDKKIDVSPRAVTAHFVEYWELHRHEMGWSDPGAAFNRNMAKDVAALRRMPLQERIAMVRRVYPESAESEVGVVVCPPCEGRNFYWVGDQPAFCDHTGRRKDKIDGIAGNEEQIWAKVLERMSESLPTPTVETWLRPTRLIGMDGKYGIVNAGTKSRVEHLERRLFQFIEKTLRDTLGFEVELVLVYDP